MGRDSGGYRYSDSEPTWAHRYLMPKVIELLEGALKGKPRRVFDLGCGNGSAAAAISKRGVEVVGVDPSEEGINRGRIAFPQLTLRVGSAYDDLATSYGSFPALISLEVVEHLYKPRLFARCAYELLEEKGVAIITTPYHGYVKNLALALSGSMDAHFTALWDHGHIKFWSERTLRSLLMEAGFREVTFYRVGRLPPIAKSMIALARK